MRQTLPRFLSLDESARAVPENDPCVSIFESPALGQKDFIAGSFGDEFARTFFVYCSDNGGASLSPNATKPRLPFEVVWVPDSDDFREDWSRRMTLTRGPHAHEWAGRLELAAQGLEGVLLGRRRAHERLRASPATSSASTSLSLSLSNLDTQHARALSLSRLSRREGLSGVPSFDHRKASGLCGIWKRSRQFLP